MKFVAFERKSEGTGASRRLRNVGKTPGIVYGGAGQPQLIELDHNALWHALKKEAFHSSILEMDLGGSSSKVLLRDVQYHPFRQQVQHVDFQRVDANTRLHMRAPKSRRPSRPRSAWSTRWSTNWTSPACRATCRNSSRWTCRA
jgi:large subunit ribosomal protein L25